MRTPLGRFGRAIVPALPPLALLAVGLVAARFARDRGAAPETVFLAHWAAGVLAALTFVRPVRSLVARVAPTVAAIAVAAIVSFLPRAGGSRAAAVAALLVLAVSIVAADALPRFRGAASTAAALAFAFSLLAHGDQYWSAALAFGTVARLVLLPAFAVGVALLLSRRGRARAGVFAGGALLLLPLLAREPWWLLLGGATLFAIAVGGGSLARAAGTIAGAGAAAALLAAAFPWLRPAPVSTLLAATLTPPPASRSLTDRAVSLTASAPRFAAELAGEPVTAIEIDSYLTHASALPCGTELARLTITGDGGVSWSQSLLVGRDSADWAVDRSDVAAVTACAPPPAWIRWIPGEGRFLGRTSRARLAPPAAIAARRLVVERAASLPPDLALALFRLSTEH